MFGEFIIVVIVVVVVVVVMDPSGHPFNMLGELGVALLFLYSRILVGNHFACLGHLLLLLI